MSPYVEEQKDQPYEVEKTDACDCLPQEGEAALDGALGEEEVANEYAGH
jgi:hypothetical protein